MEIVYKVVVASFFVLWAIWSVWMWHRYSQLLPLEKAAKSEGEAASGTHDGECQHDGADTARLGRNAKR